MISVRLLTKRSGPCPPPSAEVKCLGLVGWVERGETHHGHFRAAESMGFADAQPILHVPSRRNVRGPGRSPREARRDGPWGDASRGEHGAERLIKLAFALRQLVRMNPAGHEQPIDTQGLRPRHVSP